ncbi:16S rRNA (guanine(527)-N(7))-methyltransferase RsmG [Novosphingobium sp. ZN18A2]|uniref:16S rRNA (guanine(527)-N(7))-methyltransferase RsmG n=1 Tax=Novosphingobium sp. ZN18A2 TaxID=3079861 RepID=UPI0030CF838B
MTDSEEGAKAWLRDVVGADAETMERLDLLTHLLIVENDQQNLVSRGTLPFVWQRHILDSAQLLTVPRETLPDGEWLDLGTGAGFPGLVIAVLQPDRQVSLVDSRRLRTDWLERAAQALGLGNARVELSRVEDLAERKYSVISARAFAPLEKLLRISIRFSTPHTLWLLPKGAKALHEVESLAKNWRHTFHVEQSLTDPAAGIIAGHVAGMENTARQRVSHRRKGRA